jgi:glutamine amidotransferase-like uncharacterized protein
MAKIVIFNDQQQTATSFLGQALRTIFKNTVSIISVNRDELSNLSIWENNDTFLFIVPPIMGESCNYNEVFTKEISQYERDFVKQGGISWRLCAGAYHALENIEYTSALSGEFKQKKSSTPLVSGTSFGPLKGLGMPIDSKNRFSDCIVTPVTCQIDDKLIEFGGCYGNGCSFTTDDPQVRILAQYSHNKNLNPAIIEKPIGQGIVIASGIVPHYGYEKHTSAQLQELNLDLLPHETARRHFMQALIGRMAKHAANMGVISEEDLMYPFHKIGKLQVTM